MGSLTSRLPRKISSDDVQYRRTNSSLSAGSSHENTVQIRTEPGGTHSACQLIFAPIFHRQTRRLQRWPDLLRETGPRVSRHCGVGAQEALARGQAEQGGNDALQAKPGTFIRPYYWSRCLLISYFRAQKRTAKLRHFQIIVTNPSKLCPPHDATDYD